MANVPASAACHTTTRNRVDLGLRLPDRKPGGRLLAAPNVGNGSCAVRVGLGVPDDVDDVVVGLLTQAYAANV